MSYRKRMSLMKINILCFLSILMKSEAKPTTIFVSCEYKEFKYTTLEVDNNEAGSFTRLNNITFMETRNICDKADRCEAIFADSNFDNEFTLVLGAILGLKSTESTRHSVWIKNCDGLLDFRTVAEPFCPVYYEPVVPGTSLSLLKASVTDESNSFNLKKSGTETVQVVLEDFDDEEVVLGSVMINSKHIKLPKNAITESYLSSWCAGGRCRITPRTYYHHVAMNFTLIGLTDSTGQGIVLTLNEKMEVKRTTRLQSNDVHGAIGGLYGFCDGRFAATIYIALTNNVTKMFLQLYRSDGSLEWEVDLNSAITQPERNIGDFRMTYGQGYFAIYFTVFGTANFANGSHGEQLTFVNERGKVMPTSFNIPNQKFIKTGDTWGCSHSLGQLVNYHSNDRQFVTICTSDLYPKGISIGDYMTGTLLYKAYGDGKGSINVQLGQVAEKNSGWNLVFTAKEKNCCPGKGVGLMTVYNEVDETTGQQSHDDVIWLTKSKGHFEQDPVIARFYKDSNENELSEYFLVGWYDKKKRVYFIGVINTFGTFVEGPTLTSSLDGKKCSKKHCISWGNRDDSFQTSTDGSVSWIKAYPNSNFVTVYKATTRKIKHGTIWSFWSSWSLCSKSCNAGFQHRVRFCLSDKDCDDNAEETKPCNTVRCQVPVSCTYKKIDHLTIVGDLYINDVRQYAFSEKDAKERCIFYKDVCGGFIRQTSKNNFTFYFLKTNNKTEPMKNSTAVLIDCVDNPGWSSWSTWFACSVTCGGGTKTRKRFCDGEEIGSKVCQGEAEESELCNSGSCPYWSLWSTWTACSTSCNNGTQLRHRTCEGDYPEVCNDLVDEYTAHKICNLGVCPGWGEWGSWSSCSITCGKGSNRRRVRYCLGDFPEFCNDTTEIEPCNYIPPCPVWEGWTQWSQCTLSCGIGSHTRRRRCSNANVTACGADDRWVEAKDVSIRHDFQNNVYIQTQVETCSLGECSYWTTWTNWSDCSQTCNEGQTVRSRTCKGDFPSDCFGNDTETKTCNLGSCGYWDHWTTWSSCTKSCGFGLWTRKRSCLGEYKNMCVGRYNETTECNVGDCVEPCKPKPCKNDGICRAINVLAAEYYCQCQTGWAGRHCTYELPSLKCSWDKITVEINLGVLTTEFLIPDEKYISMLSRDNECIATAADIANNRKFLISIPSPITTSCGSHLKVTRDEFRISNKVIWEARDGNIRSSVTLLDFTCVFRKNVSASTIRSEFLEPMSVKSFKKELEVPTAQGTFEVDINLYQDEEFKHLLPVGASLVEMSEGEIIFVSVNANHKSHLQSLKEDIVVVLDTCFVTASLHHNDQDKQDLQSPLMYLVQNKCPVSVFVNIISNGEDTEGRFSVRVFGWGEKHAENLYIHCTVEICESLENSCKPTCRNKRSLDNVIGSEHSVSTRQKTIGFQSARPHIHVEQIVNYSNTFHSNEEDMWSDIDFDRLLSFGPLAVTV